MHKTTKIWFSQNQTPEPTTTTISDESAQEEWGGGNGWQGSIKKREEV